MRALDHEVHHASLFKDCAGIRSTCRTRCTRGGACCRAAIGGRRQRARARAEIRLCVDLGWFKHLQGTVAYEWTGAAPVATRAAPASTPESAEREMRARKPTTHNH